MKRTKWEILEDRMLNAGEAVGYSAWRELRALERTPFTANGTGQCSTCGALLSTEADFAKHYLIDDERYLNLGMCPTRTTEGHLKHALDIAYAMNEEYNDNAGVPLEEEQ